MSNKWRNMRLSEIQDRRVKLTSEKKKEILRKYQAGGCSLRSLAREYNVSHKTIALIVNGRVAQTMVEQGEPHPLPLVRV